MSKKDVTKAAEEEWEDVEEGEEDEEDEDTTINNSDVVVKYKKAALWANETIAEVLKLCVPGAKVVEVCAKGDALMQEKLKSNFRGIEKSIAVPTTISINNCACGFSPVPGEETTPLTIALGDLVKVDLGLQIDGYPAVVAQTILVTADGKLPADARETNLIQAAYTALNTAIRKFRPGVTNYEITDILEKTAEHFGVAPVEGVLSHMMKRYIIDGWRAVPGKRVPEHAVHEYHFENAQVWTLDVVYTTGKGKLKERDAKTSIYKIALESGYQPKMESARDLHKEIDANFFTFPFSLRQSENKKARLGLSEMLKHGLIVPYPVLYEKDGELVAQFKVTLLITNKKIERITGIPPQEFPTPAKPFVDETLIEASKASMSLVEKPAKK